MEVHLQALLLWGCSLIGFVIRVLALSRIDRNKRVALIPQKDLVIDGIYKHVRHPAYTGSILIYFSLMLLASNNLFLTIVFTHFVMAFFMDRIDREERIMINFHGNKYVEYINKTKKLIPFIW